MQTNNIQKLIHEIEKQIKIDEIISDYIQIERKGNNFVALCPFHDDKNPSMSISPNKKIFKCFSCGASGNAITFVQNYENVSFIEALKKISNKLSINWKEFISEKRNPIDKSILDIWEINKVAKENFSYNLLNESKDKESNVYKYINKRDLTSKDIQEFEIGFSPKDISLVKFLLAKGFNEDLILNSGLGHLNNEGKLVDYFYDRLIFPILDKDGNTIGFSGRSINDKESKYVKYLNTKETKVFHKGNSFYNISRAKSPISLKGFVLLVEGYMDVISLNKKTINNVLATMGTSISPEHIKTLKQLTQNIILAYDNDEAGINATKKIAQLLINENFNVKVFEVDDFKDIDEFSKNKSFEEIKDLLEKTKSFYNFLIDNYFKKWPTKNFDSNELEQILKLISKSKSDLEKSKFEGLINEKYGISKSILKKILGLKYLEDEDLNLLNEAINQNYIDEQNKSNSKLNFSSQEQLISINNNEGILFSLIISNFESFKKFKQFSYFFKNDRFNKMITYLERTINENGVKFEDLILEKKWTSKNIDLEQKDILFKIENIIEKLKYDISVLNKNELWEQFKKASTDNEKIYFLNLLKSI